MTGKFISIEKAAERLGVSIPSIRNYIKRGTLKAHRFGGVYRISEEAVEEFIQNSVVRLEKKDEEIDPSALAMSR